jgi:hypothetical protein
MRRLNPALMLGLVVCGFFVFVPGCKAPDKLLHGNFTQIKPQTTTENGVVALIGEPDTRFPGYWLYQRPDQHLTVLVEFDEKGQVTRKQWIDAMGHQWDDSEDKPQ